MADAALILDYVDLVKIHEKYVKFQLIYSTLFSAVSCFMF